jgi:arginase
VRLGLIGAPLRSDRSTEGVELVPAILRDAGGLSVLHGLPGSTARDFGVLELPKESSEPADSPTGRVRRHERVRLSLLKIARAAALALEEGYIPVVVGGDCSVLLGAIAGIHDGRSGRRLGLLSLDGQLEYRLHSGPTAEGEPSGAVLALLAGRGDMALARLARNDFPLVQERDVLRAGVRNITEAELSAAESAHFTAITPEAMAGAAGAARMTEELGKLLHRVPDLVFHVSATVLSASAFPASLDNNAGGISALVFRRTIDEFVAWRHQGSVRLSGIVITGIDGRKDSGGVLTRSLFENVVRVAAD